MDKKRYKAFTFAAILAAITLIGAGMVSARLENPTVNRSIGMSDIEGLQTAINAKATSSHSHIIADTTGLQTVLDGKAGTSTATTLANGLLSSSDKTKLEGLGLVKRIRVQTDSSGAYTWVFSTPFASGTVPVVTSAVENTTANSIATVNIVSASSTGVLLQVRKTTITTILGVDVLALSGSPQSFIHLTAIEP